MSETITIAGNIATEPERKTTAAGLTITTFRVASSQRRYDAKSGEWVDGSTNWFTVSVFRRLAEHAFHSLHKGERVLVSGKLKIHSWEREEKSGTSVTVEADAIGHDLMWGTTVFTKDTSAPTERAVATEAESADGRWSENAEEGDWNVPGSAGAQQQPADKRDTGAPRDGSGLSEEAKVAVREVVSTPF